MDVFVSYSRRDGEFVRQLVPLVKTILTNALKKTQDSEVKSRAARLLYTCSGLQSTDDDAPPPGVKM